MATSSGGPGLRGRLLRDPWFWLITLGTAGHGLTHYASYIPSMRPLLGKLPYFTLHATHEAEFIAIIALAAYRFRALGGAILLAMTGVISVPYLLTPYIFGRAPRPGEVRDRLIEVAVTLAVGAVVVLLSELHARERDRRQQALDNLQRSNLRLSLANQLGEALAKSLELPATTASALDKLAQSIRQSAVAIYLLSRETGSYVLAGQRGFLPGGLRSVQLLPAPPGDGSSPLKVTILAPVAALPPPWAWLREALPSGHRSSALFPLTAQGMPLGALVVASELPLALEDQDFLMSAAHTIGLAIDNAQLYESERRERAVAEGLARALGEVREPSRP